MVRSRRYLIATGYFLLFVGPLLNASSQVNGAGEGAALVFRVFFIGSVKPIGLKVETAPDEVASIEFQNYRRSAPYEYNGKQPIVFFREIVHADNTVTRLPVATVHLFDSAREHLLFFVPIINKKESGKEFQLFSINDSFAAFPIESLVVFNATTKNMIGRVGKENIAFPHGFSKVFSMRDYYDAEENLFFIPVGFAVESKEGPQIVFTNTFEFHPGNRIILILNSPNRPGSHRLKVNKLIDAPASLSQTEE